MAKCPKCGYKLKITDWRPECPKCGVNIVYYGMENQLLDDADSAEAEHAHFQKRLDRLKASFIGSKFTIIRIILSLLPVGALFLPLAKIAYSGPFFGDKSVAVNALEFYNFVSGLNFDSLFAMLSSKIMGNYFIFFALSVVFLLLSVVLIVVSFLCLTMACGPKGNKRNITFNVLMIVFAVLSIIFFVLFNSGIHSVFPTLYSGSIGIGAFVYLLTLVLLLAINIIIALRKDEVKYKQCYIGGIKAEEYFELVENGTDISVIREKMSAALAVKAEEEAKKKAEAEKKELEEAEKKLAESKK